MKSLLITLEGIDGSGKSTAAKGLAINLQTILPQLRFVFTAEPTKGEIGKILKAELSRASEIQHATSHARRMEELFLFIADHADHLAGTIIPSLQEGAIVISDRYADSTVAYQGVTLSGIVSDPVHWIRNLFSPWNVLPTKTFLFAIHPDEALERIQSRGNQEKFERAEFLKKVDKNFMRLVSIEPERFVLIDASKDIEDVLEQALKLILDLIFEKYQCP